MKQSEKSMLFGMVACIGLQTAHDTSAKIATCGHAATLVEGEYRRVRCCNMVTCFLGASGLMPTFEQWNTRANELSIAKAALTRAIDICEQLSKEVWPATKDEDMMKMVCYSKVIRRLTILRDTL